MKCSMMALADHVTMTADGKSVFVGVFDLVLDTLEHVRQHWQPIQLPPFYVGARIVLDEDTESLDVTFRLVDDVDLVRGEWKLQLPTPKRPPEHPFHALPRDAVGFLRGDGSIAVPSYGTYRWRLLVGGVVLGETTMHVHPLPQPAQT